MVKETINLSSESEECSLPVFREAVIWMENVLRIPIPTGRSFRSPLASGVVLCQLLNAIQPGAIRRVNQCNNRAAATDNLAQFLDACEHTFGIPQSRMFSIYDFEDIFDQGIDINCRNMERTGGIKRSEKVVITLFWLAKSLERKGHFNHLPKLDYTAFSELLPKTLIHSKLSVSGGTSRRTSITSGDAVDPYSSPGTLSSYPANQPRYFPRQTSLLSADRSGAPLSRPQPVDKSQSSPAMEKPPTDTYWPQPSSTVNQYLEPENTSPNVRITSSPVNGDAINSITIKHSSMVIERMPQPTQPVNPSPPSTESGHAEIVITTPIVAEVEETSAAEPASEAISLSADHESRQPDSVPTRAQTNDLSRPVSSQLNNNMMDEEEAWQSSLSDWKERRQRQSRIVDQSIASVVANEQAEENRRLEEARERIRKMKSHRHLTSENLFTLPMEHFSPPPSSSPGIALLTGGGGVKLSEVTDESDHQPAPTYRSTLPISSTDDQTSVAAMQHSQAAASEPALCNDVDHVTDDGMAPTYVLSRAPDAEVNGHFPSTTDHFSSQQSSSTEKQDSSGRYFPAHSSALNQDRLLSSPILALGREEQKTDADLRIVKFLLQCKPGSSEIHWGLTMRAEGSDSTAPFVVDRIKIGSSADLAEINKGDILFDINGQRFSQAKASNPPVSSPSLTDLQAVMDGFSQSKKPISVQFLRKMLRTDEFSDTDLGDESSQIISKDETPVCTETPAGTSDIDEQGSTECVKVVDLPAAEIKHSISPDHGHSGWQLLTDALPNESSRETTGLELGGHEVKEHVELHPPTSSHNEGRERSRVLSADSPAQRPLLGRQQVDSVYIEKPMEVQWLQSSPGAEANATLLQTSSSQSEECPEKSQPTFDMSVRHGKASLVDPGTHMNLVSSIVSVEVRNNHQVRQQISVIQPSCEVLLPPKRRDDKETVIVETSLPSPAPPPSRHSFSPLPPPPHPLLSTATSSPISFVKIDRFKMLQETIRLAQPGTESQGVPFIPTAPSRTIDSRPGVKEKRSSTLPSPPPASYFAVHNEPQGLPPVPSKTPSVHDQGSPEPRRSSLPSRSTSGVAILTLPPKAPTVSSDHRPGLLPKPPGHVQSAHHPKLPPCDSELHRQSLPTPTSPVSLRRLSDGQQSDCAPIVYTADSHSRPPVQQSRGYCGSVGCPVDRREPPPQPPRVPLDRGVNAKTKCNACNKELGTGDLMIVYSMSLYYHLTCFVCARCGFSLGDGLSNVDVRIRNGLLYCESCYPSRRRSINIPSDSQHLPHRQALPRVNFTEQQRSNDRRLSLPRQQAPPPQHTPVSGSIDNLKVISRKLLGNF